jgi:hypothetical protein
MLISTWQHVMGILPVSVAAWATIYQQGGFIMAKLDPIKILKWRVG